MRPGPGPLSMWVIFLVAETVPPSLVEHSPKLRVLIIAIGHWPEMANIWSGGQKTARREAKRPPTGKPIYPELPQDMEDLWSHWVRAKEWGFHRCRVKNAEFRAKNGPWQQAPAPGPPCNGVNTKILPIGCPLSTHNRKKNLDHFRKNEFGAKKKCIFRPKFCIFYATPMKSPFFRLRGT